MIPPEVRPGPIAWMAAHRVAPGLVMLVLLLGGLLMAQRIRQEIYPEFDLDQVVISVSYPGAGPEEVEQGIVLAVEEAIRGIDGIKEVSATAEEGRGSVTAELLEDAAADETFQDIQQAVNRITTFPDDTEAPRVVLAKRRIRVIDLMLYGEVDPWVLRECAEQVRDVLLSDPGITQVDLVGARDVEVVIEVPATALRRHGLTLADVGRALSAAAVEVPAGSLDTAGGEILVRVAERRDWAREFASIPVVAGTDGALVRLGEIAHLRDGFEDSSLGTFYDGRPAIGLQVFRVGDQTPTGVADDVRRVMASAAADLPAGVDWAVNNDRSDSYRQRLGLLLKNAAFGLVVVMICLSLFLEIRLAFWVMWNVPTAFLGTLLLMPVFGVSINMISMFAFIVALGIVVDAAVVVGENIANEQDRGRGLLVAAVAGTRGVNLPLAFSILTNIASFVPLAFLPGMMGKTWKVIPVVVVIAFVVSWFEAIFIMPSHLAHQRSHRDGPLLAFAHRWQGRIDRLLQRFVRRCYGPLLGVALRWRYAMVAGSLALSALVAAWVHSGRIGLIFGMPRIEADSAVATLMMPLGSPDAAVDVARHRLEEAARRVTATRNPVLVRGMFSQVTGDQVQVEVYLADPDVRARLGFSTRAFTDDWRRQTGEIVGAESLRFESDRGGPGGGRAITVELAHRQQAILEQAAAKLAERLLGFPTVTEADDGFVGGKRRFDLTLTDRGRALGLDATALGRQVRDSFQGNQAIKQLRGRHEVTVRLRSPEVERSGPDDIDRLLVRTATGTVVPLAEVATVHRSHAATTINRRDGRRTIEVTADVEPLGSAGLILGRLTTEELPRLVRDFPGLTWGFEGRQAEFRESNFAMLRGLGLALLVIYVLLALPFRSYTQPLVVMVAIPIGGVGAVLGHLLMGYDISTMSIMGFVALAGVVVNDALVLIDYTNNRRADGVAAGVAVREAGERRFRQILLTTLTTFGGLAPMILETSRQARFMIPMAISLGYGILFASCVTLVLVPCLYLMIDDLRRLGTRRRVGAGDPI